MDNFENAIAYYIDSNKKKNRLNKTEIEGVIKLLQDTLREENRSVENYIYAITSLHYSVTKEFAKTVFRVFDAKMKKEFISELLLNEKIVSNANNFGMNRILVMVNELLKIPNNEDYVHRLLQACIKNISNDVQYKSAELLYRYCLKNTKGILFTLNFSSWPEKELKIFSTWAGYSVSISDDENIKAAYENFQREYLLCDDISDMNDKLHEETLNEEDSSSSKKAGDISLKKIKEKIISIVENLDIEINNIMDHYRKLVLDFEIVKGDLEHSNYLRENLARKLYDARKEIDELKNELGIRNIKIQELEASMKDMDERLQYAYKADNIKTKQEIARFKNELTNSLKLDYKDFLALSEKNASEYPLYYEGLLDVTRSVFDVLIKKGLFLNRNEG